MTRKFGKLMVTLLEQMLSQRLIGSACSLVAFLAHEALGYLECLNSLLMSYSELNHCCYLASNYEDHSLNLASKIFCLQFHVQIVIACHSIQ